MAWLKKPGPSATKSVPSLAKRARRRMATTVVGTIAVHAVAAMIMITRLLPKVKLVPKAKRVKRKSNSPT